MKFINIEHRPQLRKLVDHIRKTNQIIILRDDTGNDLATIKPSPIKRRRLAKGKPLTETDSLWDIVGMAESDEGPTDVSRNKHTYLAEAYLNRHE